MTLTVTHAFLNTFGLRTEQPVAQPKIVGATTHANFQELLKTLEKTNAQIKQGISKEPFKRIPDSTCTICLDDLNSGCDVKTAEEIHHLSTRILETPCGHYFHESCVEEWLSTQSSCPLCRSVVYSTAKDHSEALIESAKTGDLAAVKKWSEFTEFPQETYALAFLYAVKENQVKVLEYLFSLDKVDAPTKYLAAFASEKLEHQDIKNFMESKGYSSKKALLQLLLTTFSIWSYRIPLVGVYVSALSSVYCLSWYVTLLSRINQVFYES